MGTEAVGPSKRALANEVRRATRAVRRAELVQRERLAQQERQEAVHSRSNSTGILVPRKYWSVTEVLKSMEDRGRATKRLPGGYIAGDLSELRKTILLCPMCKHGFDWKKHQYYNVSHYDHIHATGRCDVCKTFSNKLEFYLHETSIGPAWTPRDRLRAQRRKAMIVA
jgi:hypothetical protein